MRVKMNIFDYFGPKLVCLLEYFGVEGALDKRYVGCYQIQQGQTLKEISQESSKTKRCQKNGKFFYKIKILPMK